MKIKYFISLFLFAILCGCATPYQPNGFGGGFSEIQLNQNTYQISFRGNAYTSPEQTNNLALRRAAELANQNGYQYFQITNTNLVHKSQTYVTPATAQTTGNAHVVGNNVYSNSYTTYTPPTVNTVDRYTTVIVVQLSHIKTANSYDARIISNQFAPKS